VALALMSRIDLSSSSSSLSDAAAGFAARVMDKWGVGRGGGCDDGVVVLLSKEDRQVRIEETREKRERRSGEEKNGTKV